MNKQLREEEKLAMGKGKKVQMVKSKKLDRTTKRYIKKLDKKLDIATDLNTSAAKRLARSASKLEKTMNDEGFYLTDQTHRTIESMLKPKRKVSEKRVNKLKELLDHDRLRKLAKLTDGTRRLSTTYNDWLNEGTKIAKRMNTANKGGDLYYDVYNVASSLVGIDNLQPGFKNDILEISKKWDGNTDTLYQYIKFKNVKPTVATADSIKTILKHTETAPADVDIDLDDLSNDPDFDEAEYEEFVTESEIEQLEKELAFEEERLENERYKEGKRITLATLYADNQKLTSDDYYDHLQKNDDFDGDGDDYYKSDYRDVLIRIEADETFIQTLMTANGDGSLEDYKTSLESERMSDEAYASAKSRLEAAKEKRRMRGL